MAPQVRVCVRVFVCVSARAQLSPKARLSLDGRSFGARNWIQD